MIKLILCFALFVISFVFLSPHFIEKSIESAARSDVNVFKGEMKINTNHAALNKMRLEHHRLRSRECERLENLLSSAESSRELRTVAEREYWNLQKSISKERETEAILEAQGIGACLVNVNDKGILIITERELTASQVENIGMITSGITGLSPEQIKISVVQ